MISNFKLKYDVFYKVLYKAEGREYTGQAIFRKNRGWEVISPGTLVAYNDQNGYLNSKVSVTALKELNEENGAESR